MPRAREQRKRAVIYDRTSVRDDASMEEHLTRSRAFCEGQGYDVIAEETDRGVSGFHDRARPGWVRVKGMIERHEVDVVVFFALSRIERSVVRTFQFAQLCEDHHVAFASVTEELNSGGRWGRVILAVLAAAAEIESMNKSDRALVGRVNNDREGWWSGGREGFGYRVVETDGGKKRLEVDERAAQLIRDAARRVLNGEAGITTIARGWTQEGVRTSGGKPFTKSHVSQVLVAERNVPQILTASTRRRLLRLFDGRRSGRREERYLLTGLLRCAVCAAPMTGRAGRYICQTTGKVHLTAVAERVNEVVIAAAEERPEPERVEVLDPTVPLVQEREAVVTRMRALGENLSIPEEVLQARSAALQRELDALDERIETARPPGSFQQLYDRVESFDPRAWLDTLISDLVVYPAVTGANRFDPERVHIEWREARPPSRRRKK